MTDLKVGQKVKWKWMGRFILGEVVEIHSEVTVKEIKGKLIKRNGSNENPAVLVKSNAGNLALKLQSELVVNDDPHNLEQRIKF
jgi:hypothetical protein